MSKPSRIKSTFKRRHVAVVMVFALMAVTLFMALASPFTLFHLKQSETTVLKSVIIIGRHGEVTPTSESYFIGEEPPEELIGKFSRLLHQEQDLTNVGKERMFLLGKYLKLRYYDRLLIGNPRKLLVRSADSDKCLESAQALLAGLNPPRNKWIWSQESFAELWQPRAIHTTDLSQDDLLSSDSTCLRQDIYQNVWKNTTKYQQMIGEFRHDLQILRQNTGLEFEDDLEMLINLDDALKTRKAYRGDKNNVPSWYTTTFGQRLAHIANVATGQRYKAAEMQQLIVGRLLHEIIENIFDKIRADLTANGASILGMDTTEVNNNSPAAAAGLTYQNSKATSGKQAQNNRDPEANMFIYMTDKQHLNALMNSLQIYTSQPNFGASLIIELHYDPINQVHFLRLFTIDSTSHNVLPEPVRVNSQVACRDSAECSPQQFERNIGHLATRKQAWQQMCLERSTPSFPATTTTTTTTTSPIATTTSTIGTTTGITPTEAATTTSTATPTTTTTTIANQPEELITSTSSASASSEPPTTLTDLGKLDESLIVGPINIKPSLEELPKEPVDEGLTTTPTPQPLPPPTPTTTTLTTKDNNEVTTTATGDSSGEPTTTSELDSATTTTTTISTNMDENSTTTNTSPTTTPDLNTIIEGEQLGDDQKVSDR